MNNPFAEMFPLKATRNLELDRTVHLSPFVMLSRVTTAPRLACRLRYHTSSAKHVSNLAHGMEQRPAGRIMTQGRGVFGALGQGPEIRDSAKFKTVSSFTLPSGEELPVRLTSAGWGHTAAVSDTGNLFLFGRPFDFKILMRIDSIYKLSSWVARSISRSSTIFGAANKIGYYPTPLPIEVEAPVTDIKCSAGLTVLLTEKGKVFTFGLNRWGQCGVLIAPPFAPVAKNYAPHVLEPTEVEIPLCQAVDAGLQHCLALTQTGEIYAWGKASRGQVGNVMAEPKAMPPYALPGLVKLEPFKEHKGKAFANGAEVEPVKAAQISAGFAHSAALSTEGQVYVWGKGMALEVKDTVAGGSIVRCEDQPLPRKVELPGGRKAVRITSSNFQLVILAEDGSMWALGMGEHDRNANTTPLRVQTDFHLPRADGDRSTATAELDPLDGRNYLLVPTDSQTLLCKGYNRVTLIVNEVPLGEAQANAALMPPTTSSSSSDVIVAPSEKNRATFPEQGIFDVVVHQGEAYLLELEVPVETEQQAQQQEEEEEEQQNQQQLRVLNYSSGWKHNVVIVEDL